MFSETHLSGQVGPETTTVTINYSRKTPCVFDKTHAADEYLSLALDQTFSSEDVSRMKTDFTKPPLDIRQEIKKLKFSVKGDVSSSCHDKERW